VQAGAFKYHQNTCKKSKKRLSLALAKAKQVFASRKRQAAATDHLVDHENQEDIPETHNDVQVTRIPAMELLG
jgi:hypothetical protein